MPITSNIIKNDVLKAIEEIDGTGIPSNRQADTHFINYNGKQYPSKLLISKANRFANGDELDPNPSNFNSIAAMDKLKKLGFSK